MRYLLNIFMMASSRQTMLANLSQQVSAVVLLLFLPNFLDKVVYAQVVFASVLLSFMPMADLGMSLVYGRLAPALIVAKDHETIQRLDASILAFGFVTSSIFSVLITLIYWSKYGNAEQSLSLGLLPLGLFWISFHTSRMSVKGDFLEYRQVISVRALISLSALPMVMLIGLYGWFVSQVFTVLLVLFYVGRRLLEPLGRVDWRLVRKHILEGVLLCAITLTWLQLLNFNRLYASINYDAQTVADYGVVGAAYQSLSTLVISAFLPFSVGILGRFGISDKDAFNYIGNLIPRRSWLILIGLPIMIEMTPYVLRFLFPSYQIDAWITFSLLYGIVFYPFMILAGNCMLGKKKSHQYLILVLIALGLSTVFAVMIDRFAPRLGAACGQLLGLMSLAWLLHCVTGKMYLEAAPEVWGRSGRLLARATFFMIIYALLKQQYL